MKNIHIKIFLVLIFLFSIDDNAHAFPGTTEYNYKYNKINYVYIMPTYLISWGLDPDYDFGLFTLDDVGINANGVIVGVAGKFLALEVEFQIDNFNFTPSTGYSNFKANGYDIKGTFLWQTNLSQGDDVAFAPYLGTGVTYSKHNYLYTYTQYYSDGSVYKSTDYDVTDKGFGWQVLKIGTKLCYKHLIADIGVDYQLGINDALWRGNLYFSVGTRF